MFSKYLMDEQSKDGENPEDKANQVVVAQILGVIEK